MLKHRSASQQLRPAARQRAAAPEVPAVPLSAAAAACPAAGAAVRRGAISQRSYTRRSAQVADSEVCARARLRVAPPRAAPPAAGAVARLGARAALRLPGMFFLKKMSNCTVFQVLWSRACTVPMTVRAYPTRDRAHAGRTMAILAISPSRSRRDDASAAQPAPHRVHTAPAASMRLFPTRRAQWHTACG